MVERFFLRNSPGDDDPSLTLLPLTSCHICLLFPFCHLFDSHLLLICFSFASHLILTRPFDWSDQPCIPSV
jgi:hypothetical protein